MSYSCPQKFKSLYSLVLFSMVKIFNDFKKTQFLVMAVDSGFEDKPNAFAMIFNSVLSK